LEIIKNFKTMKISGNSVDNALAAYVKKNGGVVATIDMELKKRIRQNGGSILSIANDRITLESSKI